MIYINNDILITLGIESKTEFRMMAFVKLNRLLKKKNENHSQKCINSLKLTLTAIEAQRIKGIDRVIKNKKCPR